ncbi:MAG: AbrB/MazE/SpoVT family DNA-binding domain-containing protein [Actinomycetota bacterium]|jgi:AbrB family looped-hinge helix DNA binding protein|nr:AbrB/MazE/SpoVT family DNA-binding domain-containing protein [Actinomycetota bacterium]
MDTGIVRKIDDLGRVVIPAEMRRTLGVREGDQLEIALAGDHIEIRPRIPTVVHQFTLPEAGRVTISGDALDLEQGEYVVQRIGRRR